MANIFNSVPLPKIPRSGHNLSHQVKTSFSGGKLVPILCELARPGDSWRVRLEQFVRTMPMIAPIMDMVDVKVDSFAVPVRLIWDDFEDFITLGLTGEFEATPPTISISSYTPDSTSVADQINRCLATGGLADYLNFPTNVAYKNGVEHAAVKLDALPFRAYQLIWNEYYMNENLDSVIPINTASGDQPLYLGSDTYTDIKHFYLKNRGWRKDYFTSALPFPQKGPAVRLPSSDVTISLSENGPMHFHPASDDPFPDDTIGIGEMVGDATSSHAHINDRAQLGFIPDGETGVWPMYYDSGLKGTGTDITPPTIEELRYCEVLQEFYEANARGGSRPKEYYRNIWHTNSKDARLDRPEYLGGYRGPITITDIDQTSQSSITAQGTLAGKGVSSGGNRLFRYHVSEWTIIMVIVSIQPKTSYYQGFRRWNLYKDAFDWPNPFFANLGEQEIYNKELYDDPSDDKNDNTFGYSPRYAECKYIPDSVHGQFRTTLDYWHLARKFGSRPNLNSAFVHVDSSEMARIFASQVDTFDQFEATFFFHVKCNMYLPYWGVPRLIHSL